VTPVVAGAYLGIFFVSGLASVGARDPLVTIIEVVAAIMFLSLSPEEIVC
jgi:hypothetical protein